MLQLRQPALVDAGPAGVVLLDVSTAAASIAGANARRRVTDMILIVPRAHARENEVARYLGKAIADEEHAGADAELRSSEADIGIHLQRRKSDVDPVEKCHDVQDN